MTCSPTGSFIDFFECATLDFVPVKHACAQCSPTATSCKSTPSEISAHVSGLLEITVEAVGNCDWEPQGSSGFLQTNAGLTFSHYLHLPTGEHIAVSLKEPPPFEPIPLYSPGAISAVSFTDKKAGLSCENNGGLTPPTGPGTITVGYTSTVFGSKFVLQIEGHLNCGQDWKPFKYYAGGYLNK